MESGKLNHLVWDVRQKGKGHRNDDAQKAKVINMVNVTGGDRNRKTMVVEETWQQVPITFPPVSGDDLSEEWWEEYACFGNKPQKESPDATLGGPTERYVP